MTGLAMMDMTNNIRTGTRTVGKNVTVKASNFNKAQQLSTSELQQVPYQSLKNCKNP
jgi:hypothetical protein